MYAHFPFSFNQSSPLTNKIPNTLRQFYMLVSANYNTTEIIADRNMLLLFHLTFFVFKDYQYIMKQIGYTIILINLLALIAVLNDFIHPT